MKASTKIHNKKNERYCTIIYTFPITDFELNCTTYQFQFNHVFKAYENEYFHNNKI